jgi:hypothetical protein
MLDTGPLDVPRLARWLLGARIPPALPRHDEAAQAVRACAPDASSLPVDDDTLRTLLGGMESLVGTPSDVHPPWRSRGEDVCFDALARPEVYRHLSASAQCWQQALDLLDDHPAASLLDAIGTAAVRDPGPEVRHRTQGVIAKARRRATARAWTVWTSERAQPELHEALQLVETGELAMAASDGAPDALARVVLGPLFDGEVTLSVSPSGVLVEWTGDGPGPESMLLARTPLEPARPEASLADLAWLAVAPPDGPLELTAIRGDTRAQLSWP